MSTEHDPLDEAFSALTGEPTPRETPSGQDPVESHDEPLPPPRSRREAREQALIAETRAQRRSEAEAARALHDLETNTTPKKPRRRGRRALIVMIVSLVVVGGLVGAVAITWNSFGPQLINRISQMSPADYEGEGTGQITISIAEGDNGTAIARTLHNAGVTKSVDAFYKLLLSMPKEPVFHSGMYSLRKEMSAAAALAALQKPGNRLEGGLLIREGETGRTIIPALAAALKVSVEDVEAAVADPASYGLPAEAVTMEGWLFPATYTFPEGTTAKAAIQIMVDRTRKAFTQANVPAEQQERVLIIASIIQREARQSQDFAKVARVIENRLAIDMKLQMDSTSQYGTGQADGSVWSSADSLRDKNEWNTYERTGLPIGPISNPGDEAIRAAMAPADGDWLYFVTVNLNTGETVFNSDFAAHEETIKKFRQWCSENPGSGC